MIVKMKKLTLLCTPASQERMLLLLRDLGVAHVEPVRLPEGDGLDKARDHFAHVQRALEVLPKHPPVDPTDEPVQEVIDHIWTLIHLRRDLEEKRERLLLEQQHLLPYGEFDPGLIRGLEPKGVCVRLFEMPLNQPLTAPEDGLRIELSRDRNSVYFAVVTRKPVVFPAAVEFPLPEHSAAVLRGKIEHTETELRRVEQAITLYSGDRMRVEAVVQEARDTVAYLEVKAGMDKTVTVHCLQGFIPVEQAVTVRREMSAAGCAVLISDIAPDDNPPTLLQNPGWVSPIRAIFKMIGVSPGYHEVDISTLFLIFFSIFFAMLVGDAGYGALFVLLTLFGKIKFRKAPQEVFNLLLITGVCTMIWGVLTGSYFGLSNIPAPLTQLRLGWLTGPEADKNIMVLCFLLGTVHLTIAHAWNTFRVINTWRALAQIGWIGSTWVMFFTARTMVLNAPFPPVMGWVMAVSVALIILFMNPVNKIRSEWFNYVILPLNIVSNFVDVVSYVRLFAVGAASFAVANSCNQMALDIGFNSLLSGAGAALIIFFGHALNILLAAMGVMVHGIRLNTLEFSGHLGMQWIGRAYCPFKKVS